MRKHAFMSFFCFILVLLFARGGWLPTDVRLDTGDTAGANDSYSQQLRCNGSNVYVVWADKRNGESDIYLKYSTDSGITWPTSEIRLDTGDTAGAFASFSPDISISGNNVYVVWFDTRNGAYDVYLNYSSDAGATWQVSDTRLDTGDTPGTYDSWRPKITSDGNNVYVVWFDTRNGKADVYFNYSHDAGANWQSTDTRLDTGDAAGISHSWQTQIACSGSNVYVVWYDKRDAGEDIYFNYSLDAGANWLTADIRLDTGDTAGANDSMWPRISCDGSKVYVAWYDQRNGQWEIYFNSSTNAGATWQATDIWVSTGDTPGANSSYWSDLCCNGSDVYVVWADKRNGEYDIYFNSSADAGITWKPSGIRLDVGDTAGANDSPHPKIRCSGDNIYTVWYDYRNGERDIYSNYSIDGGVSWQSSDIRLDTGDPPGASISDFPELASYGDNAYVAWRDSRNGARDIYFNRSALPVLDIKANASDGPITIAQGDALSVIVDLDAGTQTGEDADWWILMKTSDPKPNNWYYFDMPTRSWMLGRSSTRQGSLFDISSKKVPKTSGLSPGTYTFYFAVDMAMNGSIDVNKAFYDRVKVTINP